MKKTISIIFAGILALVLIGCDFLDDLLGGDTDIPEEIGKVEFSLDLTHAKAVGYTITRVQATLTHQTATTDPVQQDLTVDSDNETATGTIHNLRTGTWDVTVELFEGTTSVGSGTGTVTVTTGATAEVNIYINLDTGSASIRAYWGLPTEGLIAYYPFNGNANDESDNSNDGIVNGAVLATDRFGTADKAYDFDGVDDYIKADADNLPTAERTVSLWFNANNLDKPVLFGYGGESCSASWLMGIRCGATQADAYQLQSHCEVNLLLYPYTTEPIGSWYHWIITTDSSGTIMYVNGTNVVSDNNFITNTIVIGKHLIIGVCVSPWGTDPYTDTTTNYYNGQIDDIRIYNRALTESEIYALYHEGGWTGS